MGDASIPFQSPHAMPVLHALLRCLYCAGCLASRTCKTVSSRRIDIADTSSHMGRSTSPQAMDCSSEE